MQHSVAVAEIGIERRQGREPAPNGVVGQVLPGEVVTPGDHMRAGHLAELFWLLQACKGLSKINLAIPCYTPGILMLEGCQWN